jgi:hypothetical protein
MPLTEPVPVPAVLLEELRQSAAQRGMYVHNAVEEALKVWLKAERRQSHRRRKPHPKHEQLTADDIRTLVRLRLSRSEAHEIARFTAWLRTSNRRDVRFWAEAMGRRP